MSIETAKKFLMEKQLEKYINLLSLPDEDKKIANYVDRVDSLAVIIIWMNSNGILDEKHCDILSAIDNKESINAVLFDMVLVKYEKTKSVRDYWPAKDFFRLVANTGSTPHHVGNALINLTECLSQYGITDALSWKKIKAKIDNVSFLVGLANGLKHYTERSNQTNQTTVLIMLNLLIDRPPEEMLACAKRRVALEMPTKENTSLVCVNLLAKALDYLALGGINTQENQGIIAKSDHPHTLANAFIMLGKEYNLEVKELCIANADIADLIVRMFRILQKNELAETHYLKLLIRDFKNFFKDKKEPLGSMRYPYMASKIATEFCGFMQIFTPEDVKIIAELIKKSTKEMRAFNVIAEDYISFNEKKLVTAKNKQQCWVFLFNFVPPDTFDKKLVLKALILDLKSREAFSGPVGTTNFDLIISASNKQMSALIKELYELKLFLDKALYSPQNFNTLLKNLLNPRFSQYPSDAFSFKSVLKSFISDFNLRHIFDDRQFGQDNVDLIITIGNTQRKLLYNNLGLTYFLKSSAASPKNCNTVLRLLHCPLLFKEAFTGDSMSIRGRIEAQATMWENYTAQRIAITLSIFRQRQKGERFFLAKPTVDKILEMAGDKIEQKDIVKLQRSKYGF